jgi:VWFA-related protein
MVRVSSFLTFAFCLVPSALILRPGASASQSQTPQFRAGVDLVQLDVSVLDKRTHLPVRGLTMVDFTVLEDGNQQKIAAFAAVDIPDPPPAPVVAGQPVTWMRDVPPDVQTNASAGTPDSRLFVMVIDDAMIPLEPRVIQQSKKAARSVIEKLSPADRMAIVLTAESQHAQDFTSDHARLLASVEKMRPGYATYLFGYDYMPVDSSARGLTAWQPIVLTDNDVGFRDMSFGTLLGVAEALMAAPDRRKALIYISPGIPVNPGEAATIKLANGEGLSSREANNRLVADLPELFRRMQRANINIYPIDPTGIAGMSGVVSQALNTLPAVRLNHKLSVDPATGDLIPDGTKTQYPVPFADDYGHFAARLDLDFLLSAAENTGGRAIVNTDDLGPGIEQIFKENGSYYLLGYQAPPTDPPGTLHRLTVRVNRPGVDVRTRSGYYTPKPEKIDPRDPTPSPMAKAVANLLPSGGLPLQVALAPIAWTPPAPPPAPGSKPKKPTDAKPDAALTHATVTIVLGLQRPAPPRPLSDTVEVQISAFTPDGVSRGTSTQQAIVAIRAATAAEPVHYEALSHIELKPGRYQLRIAAYSAISDATGSVYADVEVPDFAKEAVSLSGVLVEKIPSLPSAPRTTFATMVPVVPTSEREFQKLDRASTFLRVYQGGSDPLALATLTTRIVDDHDVAVVNKTDVLAPEKFDAAARTADYRFEIPLTTLSRGQYLLTFEAAVGGTSARRQVRFTVK